MSLYEEILAYVPENDQERADRAVILNALEHDPACFDRSAQAHIACSIWVVDPTAEQTLLVYHNIYDSWSWIGGHADGERDLAAVALRELEEETGVAGARIVTYRQAPARDADGDAPGQNGAEARTGAATASAPAAKTAAPPAPAPTAGEPAETRIYSLEVLTVDGHEKRGAYVSSHLHLNVTYLAVADPKEPLRIKPDENSGVKWAPVRDAVALSTEPWIRKRIYRKLIGKLSDPEVSFALKKASDQA